MDSARYSSKTGNPYDQASFLSTLFFWWTYYVIKRGREKAYEVEDLPEPPQNDYAYNLGNKIEQSWFEELKSSKNGKRASLLNAIFRIFWKELICISIIHGINDLFIAIWKQILLGSFLMYLKRSKIDSNLEVQLIFIGVTLINAFALNSLLQNNFLCKSTHLGGRIKIALSSLVYRKCLRLNCATADTSAGRVVNLLSNDLRQFDMIIMFCHYIWSGLLATAIILLVIVNYFGAYPALACLISVLVTMPVQVYVSKALAKNRAQTAFASDKRIQAMDEVVSGIQIIKMYAWEQTYEKLIQALRRVEMKLVRKNIYLRGFQIGINLFTSKFSMYILIVMYALIGGDIVPERVFLLVGYCAIFAKVLCGMCFRSFGECAQCLVSINRIQNFLELQEFDKPGLSVPSAADRDIIIQLVGLSATWSLDSNRETLKDVTLCIETGSLSTIIGEVGSGKSSILNIMLGELPAQEGKFTICGTVSYYCQSPWIFAGTIKQNILFSEEFEKSRYERVIEVCALQKDFEILPDGDTTVVGERGVTLSGGQKARIALARAVYKRADIYLLDDPLSAVDTKVSKKIFDECILEFLKDKTRVLVTHQLQFVAASDNVVLLEKGKVIANSSFNEVISSDIKFIETIKEVNWKKERTETNGHSHRKSMAKARSCETFTSNLQCDKKELEKEDTTKVKKHALLRYMKQGAGIRGIVIVFSLSIITQMLFVAFDVWLQRWTAHTDRCKMNSTHPSCGPSSTEHIFSVTLNDRDYYITIYTSLMISIMILVLFRNIFFAYYGQSCAQKIHERSLHSVMYANMEFFHKNPSGRILNRFSRDLGTADLPLVVNSMDSVTSMLQVMAGFLISAVINIWFMFPAFLAIISLYFIRKYYLTTSRNLKRVESVAKSPVFVHVHSTLQGLPIIRSSSAAAKLVEEFDQCQDVHTSAWFLYNYISYGYAYALDAIGIIYLSVIVIGSIYLDDLSGSEVGLCLAQVVIVLNFTQWAMKQTAEVSNDVTSVDRLLQYTILPAEAQPTKCEKITEEWPSEGRICFKSVDLSYGQHSPQSVRNLNFEINPQEKIGIVGRTGAGKSSLLAAIFRLGFVEGTIKIDGIDTGDVPLQTLRSKISVIPQDPVLFSGTIRKNLDPFGEFNDDKLWAALEEAELKKTLSEEDGANGLNSIVSENGQNFSVGQRQLLCLARAILRNNKILILDEATANVDQSTDSIIQKTIRRRFKLCTVLTIAHRLNTVVDSDRILVMDNGTVVEFDHPYVLLSNHGNYFYQLVAETGEFVAATLTAIAKENFDHHKRNTEPMEKKTD